MEEEKMKKSELGDGDKKHKNLTKKTDKKTNKQTKQTNKIKTLKESVDGEPVCRQAILQ